MPIDVTAARAATPGCQDLIHLNNAGAALPTHDVLTTQIDYVQFEARIGGKASMSRSSRLRVPSSTPASATFLR